MQRFDETNKHPNLVPFVPPLPWLVQSHLTLIVGEREREAIKLLKSWLVENQLSL